MDVYCSAINTVSDLGDYYGKPEIDGTVFGEEDIIFPCGVMLHSEVRLVFKLSCETTKRNDIIKLSSMHTSLEQRK